MRSIEELKQEQYDLKAKLHEIIEVINSEQYYELSDGEKGLINQQRVGMELYLNCLTKRIYGNPENTDTSSLLWLTLLCGMFNSNSSFGSTSSTSTLKESDFEDSKEDSYESGCSN